MDQSSTNSPAPSRRIVGKHIIPRPITTRTDTPAVEESREAAPVVSAPVVVASVVPAPPVVVSAPVEPTPIPTPVVESTPPAQVVLPTPVPTIPTSTYRRDPFGTPRNNVVWAWNSTQQRVNAPFGADNVTGDANKIVESTENKLRIKNDGVYHLQVFGKGCDTSIECQGTLMGVSLNSPVCLATGYELSVTTTFLKAGDSIVLSASPKAQTNNTYLNPRTEHVSVMLLAMQNTQAEIHPVVMSLSAL